MDTPERTQLLRLPPTVKTQHAMLVLSGVRFRLNLNGWWYFMPNDNSGIADGPFKWLSTAVTMADSNMKLWQKGRAE